MKSDPNLWRRLQALSLNDHDAVFPFSARLARDNGWSTAYAQRVVEEYRRFAYLAIAAGHEVTPSDEVDQAWHLHLTYTRHYWGPFREALGADLHHGPTKGGTQENHRYRENYENTIQSYERQFGETPPVDIWPPAERRFGAAPMMRRVCLDDYVMIPKKALRRGVTKGSVMSVGAAVLFASAAAASAGGVGVTDMFSEYDVFIAIAAIIGGVLALFSVMNVMKKTSKNRSQGGGTGCGGGAGCGGKGGKGDVDGGSGCSSGCGGGGCGGG